MILLWATHLAVSKIKTRTQVFQIQRRENPLFYASFSGPRMSSLAKKFLDSILKRKDKLLWQSPGTITLFQWPALRCGLLPALSSYRFALSYHMMEWRLCKAILPGTDFVSLLCNPSFLLMSSLSYCTNPQGPLKALWSSVSPATVQEGERKEWSSVCCEAEKFWEFDGSL